MCLYFDIEYKTKRDLKIILNVLKKHKNLFEYKVFKKDKIIRVVESLTLSKRSDEERVKYIEDIIEKIYSELRESHTNKYTYENTHKHINEYNITY